MSEPMEEPLLLFGSSVGERMTPRGGKLSRFWRDYAHAPAPGAGGITGSHGLDSAGSDNLPQPRGIVRKLKKFSQMFLKYKKLRNREKRMDEILRNILLTKNLDDDTLVLVGNALQEEMLKREKEQKVLERFGKITEHVKVKNNRTIPYYMAYDGRKQITASTRDKLVDKLFSMIDVETTASITVEELFFIYYEERRNDTSISGATSKMDLQSWNKYYKGSEFASMKVSDLTTFVILKEYKRIAGRGDITRKAFNKAAGVLNGMLDLAVERNIVVMNGARNTSTRRLTFKPENDNSEMVYQPEDRDKLIAHIKTLKQTRYTLAVRLMACFPLRVGELRALTWDDYDVEERKLHIHHQIVKDRKGGKERSDKDVAFTKGAKQKGIRFVKVSQEAAQVLEELRVLNGDKQYILNGAGNAQFSISSNKINEHLKKYCEQAGVTYYSSHKFRFYGASELYKAGVELEKIQKYLGHTDAKMTAHYLRLKPSEIDDEIIERIFG